MLDQLKAKVIGQEHAGVNKRSMLSALIQIKGQYHLLTLLTALDDFYQGDQPVLMTGRHRVMKQGTFLVFLKA